MPNTKNRRKKQVPAQKLAHNRVFMTSKEYRELLVKLHSMGDKLAAVQNFLGSMIANSKRNAEAAVVAEVPKHD